MSNDLGFLSNKKDIDLYCEEIFSLFLFAFGYGVIKRLLYGLNTENGVDINNSTEK